MSAGQALLPELRGGSLIASGALLERFSDFSLNPRRPYPDPPAVVTHTSFAGRCLGSSASLGGRCRAIQEPLGAYQLIAVVTGF